MSKAGAADGAPVATSVSALRAQVRVWKSQGLSVALIPTMGALHAGHQSLIRLARTLADRAVVSLFVNPIQFGPKEDFAAYPRQPDKDRVAVAEAGGDLAYMPSVEEMYPGDFTTSITVAGISSGLCGDRRPGHFDGVATVVAKLLLQCLPDTAIFGEKDYQQLLVVKRLVRNLDIPTTVVGAPTVREADGLAMSSRNAYLSPEQRAVAPAMNAVMRLAVGRLKAGEFVPRVIEESASALVEAGFSSVDYLELRDAETLSPVNKPLRPCRLLAAAYLGKTRLIDNLAVD